MMQAPFRDAQVLFPTAFDAAAEAAWLGHAGSEEPPEEGGLRRLARGHWSPIQGGTLHIEDDVLDDTGLQRLADTRRLHGLTGLRLATPRVTSNGLAAILERLPSVTDVELLAMDYSSAPQLPAQVKRWTLRRCPESWLNGLLTGASGGAIETLVLAFSPWREPPASAPTGLRAVWLHRSPLSAGVARALCSGPHLSRLGWGGPDLREAVPGLPTLTSLEVLDLHPSGVEANTLTELAARLPSLGAFRYRSEHPPPPALLARAADAEHLHFGDFNASEMWVERVLRERRVVRSFSLFGQPLGHAGARQLHGHAATLRHLSLQYTRIAPHLFEHAFDQLDLLELEAATLGQGGGTRVLDAARNTRLLRVAEMDALDLTPPGNFRMPHLRLLDLQGSRWRATNPDRLFAPSALPDLVGLRLGNVDATPELTAALLSRLAGRGVRSLDLTDTWLPNVFWDNHHRGAEDLIHFKAHGVLARESHWVRSIQEAAWPSLVRLDTDAVLDARSASRLAATVFPRLESMACGIRDLDAASALAAWPVLRQLTSLTLTYEGDEEDHDELLERLASAGNLPPSTQVSIDA